MIKKWDERIVSANPPYIEAEEISKAMLDEIDESRAHITEIELKLTAASESLEEVENRCRVKDALAKGNGKLIDSLRAKLATVEAQEPVALITVKGGKCTYTRSTDFRKVPDGDFELYIGATPFDPDASYQAHLDSIGGIGSEAAPANNLLRITALGLSKILHSQPLDAAHAGIMANRIVELTGTAAPVQLSDEQLDQIANRCTPNIEMGCLNYKMFAREVLKAAGAAPAGLVEVLKEASQIFSELTISTAPPSHRWTIADELYGFALMLEEKK